MKNQNEDIGIKNRFKIYQVFIIAAFVLFLVFSVVFWIFCYSDYNNNKLLRNGIEVEAEIVGVFEIDLTPSETYTTRGWSCSYLYVDSNNRQYWGSFGEFSQKQYADQRLGEKIKIVIDPTDGYSTEGTLASLSAHQKDWYRDFPLACVFTGLLCFAAYLFFYRYLYRSVLDAKILQRGSGRFVNNYIREGEVIKVRKWIVCYVKVKYQDENDVTREKWARSWFTHKEAKALQQKKIIKIVPYKNTYGIMEKM